MTAGASRLWQRNLDMRRHSNQGRQGSRIPVGYTPSARTILPPLQSCTNRELGEVYRESHGQKQRACEALLRDCNSD